MKFKSILAGVMCLGLVFAGSAAMADEAENEIMVNNSAFVPSAQQHMLYAGISAMLLTNAFILSCQGGCGPDQYARGDDDRTSGNVFAGLRYGMGPLLFALPTFIQFQMSYLLLNTASTFALLGDLHPNNGNDVAIRASQRFAVMVGIGIAICTFNSWVMDMVAGVTYRRHKTKIDIREDAVRSLFQEEDDEWNPTLGLGLSSGNVRFRASAEWQDGDTIRRQSQNFGFNYALKRDDEVQFELGLSYAF